MRSRGIAVSAATIIAAVSLSPLTAQADSGRTLYVKVGSTCSDSGIGTAATPYCTIQAAADQAIPGDTVSVAPGTYTAETDITKSGTAGSPIKYVTGAFGGYSSAAVIDNSAIDYGFKVSYASYVSIQGFTVDSTVYDAIQVTNSNYVTVDSTTDYGAQPNVFTAAIQVYGTSSNVTVSRNRVHGTTNNYGIYVDGSGTGNVVTTNVVTGAVSNGIMNDGASGTALVSNTVVGFCGIGMNSGGNSAGAGLSATIENNVVANESCNGSVGISWGASADVSSENYNVVYLTGNADILYGVNGVNYTTLAAMQAATGQGAEDLNANPGLSTTGTITSATSPLIDSADSSAPGELSTDIAGNARVDDPLVTDSGAGTSSYYDRGGYEYQDPIAMSGSGVILKDLGTLTVEYEADVVNAWGPVTVEYNFGDGSPVVSAAAGVPVTHTYLKPGTMHTLTATATDTSGGSATGTEYWSSSGSDFTAYGPTRILDTRKGLGAVGPLKSGADTTVKIAGTGAIPSRVTAVVLNLTVVNATGGGNISASDTGAEPNTSTVNYSPGVTVANEAIVPVDIDGYIKIYNIGGNVDLVGDVTGYFTPSAASGYTPLTPARILDTRSGLGAPQAKVAALGSIPLTIEGADSGALPASGITAVALHVTETDATDGGFLTAYPDGESVPNASNLNFTTGSTISNTVIVPLGADGKIRLYNGAGAGSIDVVADVAGYYSTSSTGAYVPVYPTRIVDTRNGTPMSNGSLINVTPSTADSSIPSTAIAYAANLTITAPTGSGLIIAYPTGSTRPGTSNLNYSKGQTVAGLSQVAADGSGDFTLYNQESAGTVQMIADIFGYYTSY